MIVGENIMGDAEVGCIVNNKQYVENMMYDLPNKWGQITFFRGRELKLLKEICWNPDNYRLFGFEVINKILGHKGKFLTCTHNKAQVIDIDSSKDLNKVKGIV